MHDARCSTLMMIYDAFVPRSTDESVTLAKKASGFEHLLSSVMWTVGLYESRFYSSSTLSSILSSTRVLDGYRK